jgi:microcystin-dependent protein
MKIINLIRKNLSVLFLITGFTTFAQLHVGDDLGIHRATKTLKMVSNNIDSIGALSASPLKIADITVDNSDIGTAVTTVDKYSTFVLQQTIAGIHLNIPVPTVLIPGRTITILNGGSASVVIIDNENTGNDQTIDPGNAVVFIFNGSKWISPGATSGITGEIRPYAGTSPPSGWKLCNGESLLISNYPGLYDAIGTSFGSADATHFNLPDFQGRFLRGADNGANNDPDAGNRTTSATGSNSGNNVGSFQKGGTKIYTTFSDDNVTTSSSAISVTTDIAGSHNHDGNNNDNLAAVESRDAGCGAGGYGQIDDVNTDPNLNAGTFSCYDDGAVAHTHTLSVFSPSTFKGTSIIAAGKGANETRPVNVAVNFIIKY